MALPARAPRDDGEADGGAMGFLAHLDELRTRIIRSAVALGLGMVVAFAFVDRIAGVVLGPTIRTLPPGTDLIATRLTEGLAFYMDLASLGGLVLAAPFVTYQVGGSSLQDSTPGRSGWSCPSSSWPRAAR
jgi:sec-independent protein translocase protein TatC